LEKKTQIKTGSVLYEGKEVARLSEKGRRLLGEKEYSEVWRPSRPGSKKNDGELTDEKERKKGSAEVRVAYRLLSLGSEVARGKKSTYSPRIFIGGLGEKNWKLGKHRW